MVKNLLNHTYLRGLGNKRNHYNNEIKAKEEFSISLAEAVEKEQAVSQNTYYRVKKGDTLIKIIKDYAKRFLPGEKISVFKLVKQIAMDNRISNPDLIFEGQKLDLSSLIALRDKRAYNNYNTERLSQIQHIERISYKDSFNVLKLVYNTSVSEGVNPYMSIAVARAESGVSANNDRKIALNPYAVNRDSKSKGVFQLIDSTGKRFHRMLGIRDRYNPFNIEQNILIGVRYLRYLDEIFAKDTVLTRSLRTIAVLDPQERSYFAIAAFNCGEGRVAKAQRLAEKEGRDPRVFRNIEKYLPSQTRLYISKIEDFVRMQSVQWSSIRLGVRSFI
ncbi:MAG: hypothetical protein KatS3mg078_0073 [Deltaproteobacteria bacterium]|nr:MAG: hypothetical protein KatS3mg078_0073 [Deltaproteobacteria bacterium]